MKPRYAGDDGDRFGLVDLIWVVLIALAFWAALSSGACAAEGAPVASVSASAGTEMLFRPDVPRKFEVFARAQADIPVVTCRPCTDPTFHLFIRADKSVLTEERPDVFHAATVQFDTLEVYGGAYRRLFGHVQVVGLYGYLVPLQPSKVTEEYPETYGGGFIVGEPTSGRWVLLIAGKHDAAGDGVKFMFAGQMPIDGRITLVSDGVVGGPKGFVRVGIALAVAR